MTARQDVIATRGAQMFPRLINEEMARLARIGEPRRYNPGDMHRGALRSAQG
jgi:hypothetical protein